MAGKVQTQTKTKARTNKTGEGAGNVSRCLQQNEQASKHGDGPAPPKENRQLQTESYESILEDWIRINTIRTWNLDGGPATHSLSNEGGDSAASRLQHMKFDEEEEMKDELSTAAKDEIQNELCVATLCGEVPTVVADTGP